MSLKIELQPRVLRWVRERAGLTREDLAEKLDTSPAKVSAWEHDGKISFKRAQDLGRSVNAPLGFLYLPEPFPQDLPIPDLRTVAGVPHSSPSLALMETIYEEQRRQEWYKEYLISQNEEPLDFVGSISRNSSPDGVAQRIRDSVGFQSEIRATAIGDELATWAGGGRRTRSWSVPPNGSRDHDGDADGHVLGYERAIPRLCEE